MYDQPTRVDGACPERPRGVADAHTPSHSTDEVLAQDYRLGASADDLRRLLVDYAVHLARVEPEPELGPLVPHGLLEPPRERLHRQPVAADSRRGGDRASGTAPPAACRAPRRALHTRDPAQAYPHVGGVEAVPGGKVSVQLVDRVLTTVNGPGLWELYPELGKVGEMHDRYCTACHEVVTVDDTMACPWCETPTREGGR